MPYRDAWDVKGPVAYLLYAIPGGLFGRNQWGLRLFDLVMLAFGCHIRPDTSEPAASAAGALEREVVKEDGLAVGREVQVELDRVGAALSGLTRGASLVLAPKRDSAPIRHVEFVSLSPDRALLVLVFADGHVETHVWALAETRRNDRFDDPDDPWGMIAATTTSMTRRKSATSGMRR